MDQQTYCNTALHNPMESQNIPDYLFSSNSANTSYENLATQDSTSLSIWHSGEPSSSGHSVNHCDYDGSKREHMWSSSMNIDAESPAVEERDFQATGPLSLERVNINLNSNHVVDADSFLQNPNSGDVPQGSDMDGYQGTTTSPASETEPRSFPYNTVLLQSAYLPSTSRTPNPSESSSRCSRIVLDDSDSRSEASLDSRRLSCKRKNIEGVSGQSSSSGNAGFSFLNENSSLHSVSAPHNVATVMNASGSSAEAPGSNPSEAQFTEMSSAIIRGTISERYPASVGEGENSERNFRMRFNPTHQHDICPPDVLTAGVTIRHSHVWSSHQSSSHAVPLNHMVDSRLAVSGSSSQPQHQHSVQNRLTPNVYPTQWNDANSRVGSQPSTDDSGERLNSSGEEAHSRSIHSNSSSGHTLLAYPSDIRQTGQDPTHLRLGNVSSNVPQDTLPTSRASTSPGTHSPVGTNWVPQHNLHAQQRLAEAVRRPSPRFGGFVSGELNNIVPARPSSHMVSSQETGHHSGVGFHGNHQSLLRSAFLAERQNDGVLGVPLSIRNLAAVRESRFRMLSEIRNALDLMRRGENLRFEDVFVLDQSAFFGGAAADLHDRHRDMRLDVDNMSYEELLALEERIGNVSTGLDEEKISKCLEQRVYIPLPAKSSNEMEPCCVCQEEYVEGEDLGTLQCGHDFHAACIKQWLTHKNLCPICKTTGLFT